MSEEKESKAKGTLLVNRGQATFHIRPAVTIKRNKEGEVIEQVETTEPRDIAPGEAFHADDEKQAEKLLNYHAIGEASEDDPLIQTQIESHKAEIERLEALQKEQKKPVEAKKAEAEAEAKKETAAEREKRKRHHRVR